MITWSPGGFSRQTHLNSDPRLRRFCGECPFRASHGAETCLLAGVSNVEQDSTGGTFQCQGWSGACNDVAVVGGSFRKNFLEELVQSWFQSSLHAAEPTADTQSSSI